VKHEGPKFDQGDQHMPIILGVDSIGGPKSNWSWQHRPIKGALSMDDCYF